MPAGGDHWAAPLAEPPWRRSPIPALRDLLMRAMGAGIGDLRHGGSASGAAQWSPPAGTACYAAAAVLGRKRTVLRERLVGDGLVTVDSALGRHPDPDRKLAIPEHRQWVGYGIGHLGLLSEADVYAQLNGLISLRQC